MAGKTWPLSQLDGSIVVTGVFTIPLSVADHLNRDSALRPSREAVINRFIGGPENRLLPAALDAFFSANVFPPSVNPLLLWGGPSSGKTYLVRGLANRWAEQHSSRKVWFLNAANIYADKLPTNWQNDGFDRLVVIDGLDQATITPKSAAVFRCWLDELLAYSIGVVVTTSRPPKQLHSLPHALQSRLAGGLVLPISKPAIDTRKLIVRGYVEAVGMVFTDEAVDLLVNRLDFEAGVLVEVISKIHIQHLRAGRKQTIDLHKINSYLNGISVPLPPGLPRIARVVAQYFGITVRDLKGRSRKRGIAAARSVFMHLAHNWAGHSLKKVGVYLGRRDHTTILHGCRGVEIKTVGDLDLANDVRGLISTLEEVVGVG